MQNYHKHSTWSNLSTPDSTATYRQYAERAVELGHGILSSVEHGNQGYYHEAYEIAKEYGLKFVFGTEAYWVRDMREKDKTNCHIVLLAKNKNGFLAINRLLSDANEFGYYYKPRTDLKGLLALPKDDVVVTTACVAFWKYDDISDIVETLYGHFGDNFYLEIQNHSTDTQRFINKLVFQLSSKLGIKMIAGLDSHYIMPEDSAERDNFIKERGIQYDDEIDWAIDYPSDEECIRRFEAQGVFSRREIQQAMDNTDITLDFEDLEFDKEVKLPVTPRYADKTQEERNEIYTALVWSEWEKYKEEVLHGEFDDSYIRGIEDEIKTICETNMADYFLIDYDIVRLGIERGGIITKTGRGSGAGFFTNTLLGFSGIDRFKSPIKLYPERFISKTRILQSKSLPDLDMNLGNPEVFATAQEDVMGKGHAYPMVAFGTLRRKSAWKMYAKVNEIPYDEANIVSAQIESFKKACKNASDDESVKLSDFVSKDYLSRVAESETYMGIIADKKQAPSAYLLYSGDIRSEIGLIRCKSESTGKDVLCAFMDKNVAEDYKYLKNDLLKVDSILLIHEIFKHIGIAEFTINELIELLDSKTWDIYKSGCTISVNQVEKPSTTKKVMKYAPRNISELTAFIAAIRPGFKSMYDKFEKREDFSYEIPTLDNLIQTPQFPYSYILYQEQIMAVLNFAGFSMDICYSISKDIAHKHADKVLPLKEKFLEGFASRLVDSGDVNERTAKETSERVWQIVQDSTSYSFNSSHAYEMALDSLYLAYLKAHYPYEFYEVLLRVYADKGDKDKVVDLQDEMKTFFGIELGQYKFGLDNRQFVANPENKKIYPSLLSVKSFGQRTVDELYRIGQQNHVAFYSVYKSLIKAKNINRAHIDALIDIGYFSGFAGTHKLKRFVKICDSLYERKMFTIGSLSNFLMSYVKEFADKTEKTYRNFDYDAALTKIWDEMPDRADIPLEMAQLEFKRLERITLRDESLAGYVIVTDVNTRYSPKITFYSLRTGKYDTIKIPKKNFNFDKINEGDIVRFIEHEYRPRQVMTDKGFRKVDGEFELWVINYEVFKRAIT